MTRNAFEARVAAELGPDYQYEPKGFTLPYVIERKYVPDFVDFEHKRIVESKGRFPAADRQKMLLVKAAHPSWEITIVLQQPNAKLYKGSKTTLSAWCEAKGFKWREGPKAARKTRT